MTRKVFNKLAEAAGMYWGLDFINILEVGEILLFKVKNALIKKKNNR